MPGSTVLPREVSPPSGTSILITSAPRSAISMYGTVPACAVEHATTLTPCSGPCGSVMAGNLQCADQRNEGSGGANIVDQRQAWLHLLLGHARRRHQPAILVIHLVPSDAE